MSKTEQQRMYEMGSIILGCAISQRLSSYDYGLRQLIFPHIKANESHGSQIGLTKKYYCYDFKRLRQSSTVVSSKVQVLMSLEECKS